MNHYFEICHYQQNVPQHYYLLDTLVTNFKINMSQFIAQMFQAGAVTECAAALLSFRYPSFTGKPEQKITTKIYAKSDDGSVM